MFREHYKDFIPVFTSEENQEDTLKRYLIKIQEGLSRLYDYIGRCTVAKSMHDGSEQNRLNYLEKEISSSIADVIILEKLQISMEKLLSK